MTRALLEIVLVFALYAVGAAVVVRLLGRLGVSTRDGTAMRLRAAALVVALGANLLIGCGALVLFAVLDPRPVAALGLRLDGRVALAALLICAASFVLAALLAVARGATWRRGPSRTERVRSMAPVALTLLVAAWMEEVLFRAYILHALSGAGVVVAVLLSAAIFTAAHLPTNRIDVHRIAGWALGGVALALVYLSSGSIWVATAAHLSRNLANVLVVEPSPEVGLARWPRPLPPEARTLYVFALSAAMIVVAGWVYR